MKTKHHVSFDVCATMSRDKFDGVLPLDVLDDGVGVCETDEVVQCFCRCLQVNYVNLASLCSVLFRELGSLLSFFLSHSLRPYVVVTP
jgi:hypothetical protein